MDKILIELDQLFKDNKLNQVVKITKENINTHKAIAPYFNLLGMSLAKLGKNDEAKKFLLGGINKFPNEISLKSNIGLVLINLKDYNLAEKYIYEAIKINKEDIYALHALGVLKREQLKFKEALIIFNKIIQKDVKFPKALSLLGQTYLDLAQRNNDKELYILAKKNFLLSSQIFPTLTDIDYILSQIIDYSNNDFHQKKMLNKIKQLKLNNVQKTFIYFALGKSFEDQKKYDQSFEYIKLANQTKNKNINKNILQNEISKFRNIKNIFSKINLTFNISEKLFQKKIIFIVGLPRSGTTLLHQLLSEAEDTYGFGESIILGKFFEKNIFDKNFISKLLNKKTIEDQLILTSNEIGQKYESISDKNVFIDKMPPNFYWIGFIKLLFPNSKIIHIKRNLKDNCLSIYKNFFGTSDMDWSYNENNILRFVINYKNTIKFWKSFYKNKIYELNYENLVKDQKEETKKLFKFCDLQWNEKIFDFYKTSKTIKTVSLYQVKKPIYQTSVNTGEKFTKYIDFLNRLKNL